MWWHSFTLSTQEAETNLLYTVSSKLALVPVTVPLIYMKAETKVERK